MWNRQSSLSPEERLTKGGLQPEQPLVAEWNSELSGVIDLNDKLGAELGALDFEPIQAKSIPIRVSPIVAKASGFIFPESKQALPPKIPNAKSNAQTPKRQKFNNSKRHRIQPPKDIVKLQDRLYYLLQPPLDLLVGSGQLNFPFEPFPYQLDGIAFLFPRYAAVLADEMGLGKTMQAISTIRLLLCS